MRTMKRLRREEARGAGVTEVPGVEGMLDANRFSILFNKK